MPDDSIGYSEPGAFARALTHLRMDTEAVHRRLSSDNSLHGLQVCAGKIALSACRVCGIGTPAFKKFLRPFTIPTIPFGVASTDLRVPASNRSQIGLAMHDLPMMTTHRTLTLSMGRRVAVTKWLEWKAFTLMLVHGMQTSMEGFYAQYHLTTHDVSYWIPEQPPSGLPSFHDLTYHDVLWGVRNAQGAHDKPPTMPFSVKQLSKVIAFLFHEGPYAVRWYLSILAIALGYLVDVSMDPRTINLTSPLPLFPPSGKDRFPSGLAMFAGSRPFAWGDCSGSPAYSIKRPPGKHAFSRIATDKTLR